MFMLQLLSRFLRPRVLFLFTLCAPAVAQASLSLQTVADTASPDPVANVGSKYGNPGEPLAGRLTLKVIDTQTGKGVPGVPVKLSNASSPEGATPLEFSSNRPLSNEQGLVSATVKLGNKGGDYVIAARIDAPGATPDKDSVFVSVHARSSNWLLLLLMQVSAGLALFMFGIGQLSEGMRKSAGSYMRTLMGTLTKNRLIAVAVGALVTVIFQSSSATTVMLVGFAQAGILNFVQSLGIILGADIGTTMTVQLIAFKITDYVLLAVALGFFVMVIGRKEATRFAGQAVMGLGILFFGMSMMADSMIPLRTFAPFLRLIAEFNNVAAGIFIGTLCSALLHSSAAVIGIVIVFASQGLLSLETGIALSLGANIGTCFTAVLASLNGSREAKRVALAHTLFKVAGVLLLVAWIPYFGKFVKLVSGQTSIERQIANAHTFFNIGITFAFLPFLGFFAKIITRAIPNSSGAGTRHENLPTLLDENLISTPALALAAAKLEVLRLGRKAQGMVDRAMVPVFQSGELRVEEILKSESEVDDAYAQINMYLKKIVTNAATTSERVEEAFQMMHTISDLEQIADIVEDRLVPLVRKLSTERLHFSEQGQRELQEYHTKTLKQISRSLDVFDNLNLERAQHVSERFEKYRMLATELQRTHFSRLRERIRASEETSEIHLEFLSAFLEISDLATNIARYMLQRIDIDPTTKLHRIVGSA